MVVKKAVKGGRAVAVAGREGRVLLLMLLSRLAALNLVGRRWPP